MSTPLISIIIPVYNVENYLRQCLDSIVAQEFSNYECIIIDDGSTDSSPLICKEYAKQCSQLKVVHKENGGVSSARNVGLEMARGEWIWFVDADDYVKEDSLMVLSKVTSKKNGDTIFHGLNIVSQDGTIKEDLHESDFLSAKDDFLLRHYCYQNGMILFSHSIIRNHHLRFSSDTKMGEDLVFQYKYLLLCKKTIRIQECLYYYRKREGSATDNAETYFNNMGDNMRNAFEMMEYVEDNNFEMEEWTVHRIHGLVKSSLQSASHLSHRKRSCLPKQLHTYCKRWKSISRFPIPFSIRLASVSLSTYCYIYLLIVIINNCKAKS